jgi:hypothetical protein
VLAVHERTHPARMKATRETSERRASREAGMQAAAGIEPAATWQALRGQVSRGVDLTAR